MAPGSAARPELVIFDCDGVLVDSEPLANAILARALSAEGLVMDVAESRRRYVGLSLATVMARAEAELGRPLSPGWLEALQQETFAAFRAELRPVPGVADAIDAQCGGRTPASTLVDGLGAARVAQVLQSHFSRHHHHGALHA